MIYDRLYRSYRAAVIRCAKPAWYRSNSGSLCQIMQIVQLPSTQQHELDHLDQRYIFPEVFTVGHGMGIGDMSKVCMHTFLVDVLIGLLL